MRDRPRCDGRVPTGSTRAARGRHVDWTGGATFLRRWPFPAQPAGSGDFFSDTFAPGARHRVHCLVAGSVGDSAALYCRRRAAPSYEELTDHSRRPEVEPKNRICSGTTMHARSQFGPACPWLTDRSQPGNVTSASAPGERPGVVDTRSRPRSGSGRRTSIGSGCDPVVEDNSFHPDADRIRNGARRQRQRSASSAMPANVTVW